MVTACNRSHISNSSVLLTYAKLLGNGVAEDEKRQEEQHEHHTHNVAKHKCTLVRPSHQLGPASFCRCRAIKPQATSRHHRAAGCLTDALAPTQLSQMYCSICLVLFGAPLQECIRCVEPAEASCTVAVLVSSFKNLY